MQNRFVKTSLYRRRFYTYYFLDGTTQTLHEGESGVTAEFIKSLHAFDDAEVYNNIKNDATASSANVEKQRIEWNKAHPESFQYRSWNLSLEAEIVLDNGECASQLGEVLVVPEETINPNIIKMREIVATMSPRQQRVYELLYIEEFKECEVAAIMGVSTARITAIKKRIIEILKEKFQRG